MGRTTQEAHLTFVLEALPADVAAVMEGPAKVVDVLPLASPLMGTSQHPAARRAWPSPMRDRGSAVGPSPPRSREVLSSRARMGFSD